MVAFEDDFEYEKGKIHPMLHLKRKEGDRWGFSFGISKARLILDNLDSIKAFDRKFGAKDDIEGGDIDGNTGTKDMG